MAIVQVWKIMDAGWLERGVSWRWLHFSPLVTFLGLSPRRRNPKTVVSDQTFQVRDRSHSGDKVVERLSFTAFAEERSQCGSTYP
jgi:hypothetical protein